MRVSGAQGQGAEMVRMGAVLAARCEGAQSGWMSQRVRCACTRARPASYARERRGRRDALRSCETMVQHIATRCNIQWRGPRYIAPFGPTGAHCSTSSSLSLACVESQVDHDRHAGKCRLPNRTCRLEQCSIAHASVAANPPGADHARALASRIMSRCCARCCA